jgi:predicted PurR-regulated permease PerM
MARGNYYAFIDTTLPFFFGFLFAGFLLIACSQDKNGLETAASVLIGLTFFMALIYGLMYHMGPPLR